MNYTIVITGLGGQGLITLIRILGNSLIKKGYKVMSSETHGLSQRGGNVTCFLRYSDEQVAPIPLIGTSDMIIALEKSTILNVLTYCKLDKSTKMIISNYKKESIGSEYPSAKYLSNTLNEKSDFIYFLDIPEKYPSNIVILGKVLEFLPISRENIEDSIKESFAGSSLSLNLEALNIGVLSE